MLLAQMPVLNFSLMLQLEPKLAVGLTNATALATAAVAIALPAAHATAQAALHASVAALAGIHEICRYQVRTMLCTVPLIDADQYVVLQAFVLQVGLQSQFI